MRGSKGRVRTSKMYQMREGAIRFISCKTRCCCPACHQKRALQLAYHLNENVLEEVSHRQFVFTIPKRLRIYFRYDRKLLGKLVKATWETVRDVFVEEVGLEDIMPSMIAGIQSFARFTSWRSCQFSSSCSRSHSRWCLS